jgi:DNA-directed RNA polymerase specialized sigma subunit
LIDEFFYQEKSEREIAEETDTPRNTLVYRKNKILDKLKKLIEKN